MKKFFSAFNILHGCRELGVPFWSCPQFIFLLMGVVINATIVATYLVAIRYTEPDIVIAIASALTVFLLIVTQVLVHSFEEVVFSKKNEAKRMQEVMELKDEFVHIALHDLGGAATAIKWGLRTLEAEHDRSSASASELITVIRSRNELLIELSRQMLLVTKIDGGKIIVNKRHGDFYSILKDLHRDFKRGATEHNVTLHFPAGATPIDLYTDREELSEILRILISRAITNSDKHGGAVRIMVEEQPTNVVVAIENNGLEIEKEARPHVFEKFWREKEKKDVAGSGFGLYAVKKLCDLLGIDIAFTSSPGKTIFTLKIPKIPK